MLKVIRSTFVIDADVKKFAIMIHCCRKQLFFIMNALLDESRNKSNAEHSAYQYTLSHKSSPFLFS